MIGPLLISLVLAGFVFLLSFRHYPSGLVLSVTLIPTFLLRHTAYGVPTNVWEMIVAAVLLAGALKPVQRDAWAAALRAIPRLPAALAAALLMAAAVSTLVSGQPAVSLGILKGWFVIPMLFAGLLYAAGRQQPALRRHVLSAAVGSALVIAAIAFSLPRQQGRLVGIYDVSNSLALYLAPLTAAVLWQALSQPRYGVSALLLFGAVAATQSLAGIIAPLLAVGIALLLIKPMETARSSSTKDGQAVTQRRSRISRSASKGRKKGAAVLLSLAVFAFAALGARDKIAYLSSGAPTSLDVRRQLWSIGSELVQEHPWLGIGLGQFEPAHQQKLHERFYEYESANPPSAKRQPLRSASVEPLPEFVFRDPHNWPLSFWLNTGFSGLAAFIALNAWLLVRARRGSAVQKYAAVMLLAILIHGLADTVYWKNDLAATYWLIAALLLSPRKSKEITLRG
ncbi:MAG: hypothetical protein COT71_00845 [Candidatus Andersenbacteria bacterium CG10_big_fil_rev_8_21_14_0_10_54_11]|uniref:O-antigen ligase-related domain-containing protein n=1 Tax=Candidatus Andersenbacteria bacterium CG10_big_fil_rev_8_21_14_0_10_54_11 TaxID=1974485 RepID=A0A2M6X097_9BACT|nr:MAG: hypothetical protein COT71_00845 [Candidatus Andersenbacteria bacterium CG10_big_fil_rev_8_21_14_0_10_54_11]